MALPQIDVLLHGFGTAYSGGTATGYLAGTTTLASWFSDAGATIPAANPYTLSVSGTATLYCNQRLKIDVKNNAGVSAPGFPVDNLGFAAFSLDTVTPATDYGASKDDVTLNAAITAIGAGQTTLYVEAGTWTLASNVTIPSNISIKIDHGTIFSVNSGKTITFNSNFEAGTFQCFSGSGNVTFGVPTTESKPEWFGALGDGTTDDTTAIQKAINATSEVMSAKPVVAYRTISPITISGGISIKGNVCDPYEGVRPGTKGQGSWFYFDHLGVGFNIIQTTSNNITGVLFEGIGTYRNQTAPGVGWTPIAADWDFSIANADVTIRNCVLLNPTKGIKQNDTIGGGYGRLTLDDVVGQPLSQGIEVTNTFDTFRCTNVRFWPYWKDDSNVEAYQMANMIGMKLCRSDNPMILNYFCIFSKYGLQISSSANGTTAGLVGTNIDLDRLGGAGVHIESSSNGANLNITNLKVQGETAATGTRGIYIEGSNSIISFTSTRLSVLDLNGIKDTSGTALIRISGLQVNTWNVANAGHQAIYATSASKIYVDGTIIYTDGNSADLVNSGTLIRSDEWVTYTPVVTATSGTITTATATGKYRHSNGHVSIDIDATVTTNGTGAGAISITLPIITDAYVSSAYGKNINSGKGLTGTISGSAMQIVLASDGTYPVTSGDRIVVSAWYSVAR